MKIIPCIFMLIPLTLFAQIYELKKNNGEVSYTDNPTDAVLRNINKEAINSFVNIYPPKTEELKKTSGDTKLKDPKIVGSADNSLG